MCSTPTALGTSASTVCGEQGASAGSSASPTVCSPQPLAHPRVYGDVQMKGALCWPSAGRFASEAARVGPKASMFVSPPAIAVSPLHANLALL